MLQSGHANCDRVLQSGTGCGTLLHGVAKCGMVPQSATECCKGRQGVATAGWCTMLQGVENCYRVLQCAMRRGVAK